MNWISVKDRLPLCNGRYLVHRPHYYKNGSGLVTMCYFDGSDDRVNFERVLSEGDIDYWMPLPEPPEEKET